MLNAAIFSSNIMVTAHNTLPPVYIYIYHSLNLATYSVIYYVHVASFKTYINFDCNIIGRYLYSRKVTKER